MIQFTSHYIDFLKSNLSIGEGVSPDYGFRQNEVSEEYLFQILRFEEDLENPKLLYGTKRNLEKALTNTQSSDSNKSSDSKLFPSSGTSLDKDFLSDLPEELRDAQRSTARFLKQARELSQLTAATWLDEENIPTEEDRDKIKLAKIILNKHNLIPDTYILDNEGNLGNKIESDRLISWIKEQTKEDTEKSLYLIKPEYVSYSSISLSLLLCGQAYYKDRNSQWTKIWKPIFSNYEMVYEYALDLSWDTYYASRTDIAQSGINQNPPYTKVTLGYPPRPPEFNLKQEDIKQWVQAGEKDSKFPFYPPEENGKFGSERLKFVAPPFPYLPLSTV